MSKEFVITFLHDGKKTHTTADVIDFMFFSGLGRQARKDIGIDGGNCIEGKIESVQLLNNADRIACVEAPPGSDYKIDCTVSTRNGFWKKDPEHGIDKHAGILADKTGFGSLIHKKSNLRAYFGSSGANCVVVDESCMKKTGRVPKDKRAIYCSTGPFA